MEEESRQDYMQQSEKSSGLLIDAYLPCGNDDQSLPSLGHTIVKDIDHGPSNRIPSFNQVHDHPIENRAVTLLEARGFFHRKDTRGRMLDQIPSAENARRIAIVALAIDGVRRREGLAGRRAVRNVNPEVFLRMGQ